MTIRRLFPLSLCLIFSVLSVPALADADYHQLVRDARGNVVLNTFNNCVRTRWMSNSDECAPPAMRKRAEISREERTVYFEFNKATLNADATAKLNSLADRLKADSQIRQASIFGYADRIGTASYNERLSKHRAENVRNYLVSRGYVNGRVTETRWFGESVPKTNCPNTLSRAQLIQCLQKDRRVEVEVEYLPERTTPAQPRRY